MKHFLSTSDLSLQQIEHLLKAAQQLSQKLPKNGQLPLLEGKTVVNLFFENSTRTRTSFEIAIRRLGGSVLNFSAPSSSVKKGETLIDTAKNIEALGAHCLVVRHASAGSPAVLAQALSLPIINAGDGLHEHPTQALLDAFAIQEKIGPLKGKHVVILGDIAHSRVARSNIHLLKKLGAIVAVCGPPTLLPPVSEALDVQMHLRPETCLPGADAVITLRIQLERQNRMQIPSIQEYAKFWGLNRARAQLLKPTAVILHPGPVNRGVELDPEVADEPRSLILDQVTKGVFVRMAVLAEILNPHGLAKWLGDTHVKQ